ncbi:MAG: FAD:protein FMN transferase [Pseudomonadota bacterium]
MVRIFLVFFVLLCTSCNRPPEVLTLTGETMGTTFAVTVVEPGNEVTPEAIEAAVSETLTAFNAAYSNWDPNSEISRFNVQQTVEPIAISAGLGEILALADEVHRKTGGRFDLTVSPLVDLWGFGTKGRVLTPPEEQTIASTLEAVGQSRVLELSVDRSTLRKTVPTAEANLAALAKGSGIDAVAERLMALGLTNLMVEVGGDLFALGDGPSGAGWRIAVERPDAVSRTIQEIVTVSGQGMATSGDYRNYFEKDGVRYAHIIDPTTGRPVTHQTASVTVLAPTAAEADAWATALLVLGAEEGLTLAEEEGLAALFISREPDSAASDFQRSATAAFEAAQGRGVE